MKPRDKRNVKVILAWEAADRNESIRCHPTFCPIPGRGYASAGTSYGPVSVCLSVCLSVTSRCAIETDRQIELLFAGELLRAILHSVVWEIWIPVKWVHLSRELCLKLPATKILPQHVGRRNVYTLSSMSSQHHSKRALSLIPLNADE